MDKGLDGWMDRWMDEASMKGQGLEGSELEGRGFLQSPRWSRTGSSWAPSFGAYLGGQGLNKLLVGFREARTTSSL